MAKMYATSSTHESTKAKTSIGRKASLCKMNKHKRRSFKRYRGQGK
jgi:hypothetical protein|tara:strand:- start:9097 stop:9234 length:138 start_codon:yes stop_codon:yes gene_type:complete